LWKRPYRIDITDYMKEGMNELKIKVTNLWPNRLIGDEQLLETNQFFPAAESGSFESLAGGGIKEVPDWYVQGKPKPDDGRFTFTTWKHYNKNSPLLESGLLGPVLLQIAISKSL
jgi:hypothetical protein